MKKTINLPKIRLGIDDLKSIHAFHGASQGDETATNDVKQFETCDGWLYVSSHFKDINYLIQSEVFSQSDKLHKENDVYIQSLKESGDYGKEVDGGTLTYEENPLYDTTIKYGDSPIESYRYTILQF